MQSDRSKSVRSSRGNPNPPTNDVPTYELLPIRPLLEADLCPPLNLRFLMVVRIVEWVTPRQQLVEYALVDFEDCDIDRPSLQNLDPAIDRVSLVIRRHRSRAAKLAYRVGLVDYGVDLSDIRPAEEGIFTLITRPTKPAWPGPLLIYIADVPANNILEDTSVAAVAPDGTLIERLGDLGPEGVYRPSARRRDREVRQIFGDRVGDSE